VAGNGGERNFVAANLVRRNEPGPVAALGAMDSWLTGLRRGL